MAIDYVQEVFGNCAEFPGGHIQQRRSTRKKIMHFFWRLTFHRGHRECCHLILNNIKALRDSAQFIFMISVTIAVSNA